jgi:hypothetical protein
MRIFRAYETATTSTTIRSSWEGADFGFHRRDAALYLWINEQTIRDADEFAEVWRIDYSEADLSPRRRQQQWGWVNARYFRKEYPESLPQ